MLLNNLTVSHSTRVDMNYTLLFVCATGQNALREMGMTQFVLSQLVVAAPSPINKASCPKIKDLLTFFSF